MMRKFDPRYLGRLISPERRQMQDPEAILDSLGLASGMTFADIGSGPGFFTLPAADKVGPTGKVYALDIEPKMLEFLLENAEAHQLRTVEAIVSRKNRLPLPDGFVDAALVADVLHEVEDRSGFLREIARVLGTAGSLGVVEWRREATEKGPPPTERIAQEEVEAVLRNAGYSQVRSFSAGPYHYGLLARK